MKDKKLTKRDKYEMAIAMAKANDNGMLVEFFTHEIELLDKKAGKGGDKKLTPEQEANEKIKVIILDHLDGSKPMTISEMIKTIPECNDFSTSKVSALVRQLKEVGLVKRTEVKGVAYFSKV